MKCRNFDSGPGKKGFLVQAMSPPVAMVPTYGGYELSFLL
jgi:hypothetical protein